VHVTVTGNSLQKNGGCDGCPDAGAASTQTIASGDGYIEFTATETNKIRQIGLSSSNPGTTTAEIQFSIRLTEAGIAEVRESNVYRAEVGYVANDRLRIAVVGTNVVYSKNGTTFHTTTNASITYPLLADTALLGSNSTITNVVMGSSTTPTSGPVVWRGLANVQTIGTNANGLQKTAGCEGCPDAGAYSEQVLASGNGYVEFTAPNTTSDVWIGFTTGSGAGTGHNTIQWAIHLSAGGGAEVRENDQYRADWSFVPGDTFRISVTGGNVVYSHNNASVYTSLVSATYPITVDASLLSVGGSFGNAIFSGGGSGGTAPPPAQLVAGANPTVDYAPTQTAASSCLNGCTGWASGADSSWAIDGIPETTWSSVLHYAPDAGSEWFAFWFESPRPTSFIRFVPRLYQGLPYGVPQSLVIYYIDSANVLRPLMTANMDTNLGRSGQVIRFPTTVTASGFQIYTGPMNPDSGGGYYFQIGDIDAGYEGCDGFLAAEPEHDWCVNNPSYYSNRAQDTYGLSNANVRFGVNQSYGGMLDGLYRFQQGRVQNMIYSPGGAAMQISLYGAGIAQGKRCEGDEATIAAGTAWPVWHGATYYPCNPLQAAPSNDSAEWDSTSNDADAIGIDSISVTTVKHNLGDYFKKKPGMTGLTVTQTTGLVEAGVRVRYLLETTSETPTLTAHPQEIPTIFSALAINHHYFYPCSTGTGICRLDAPAQLPQGHGQLYVKIQGRSTPFHVDSDNDSVRDDDDMDHCPNQAGTPQNYGCPEGGMTPPNATATAPWITACDASESRCVTVYAPSALVKEFALGLPGLDPREGGATGSDSGHITPLGDFGLGPNQSYDFTVYVFPYRYNETVAGQTIRAWIELLGG
jgi:hypothetical protein